MSADPVELAKQLIRCPSITPESAGVMDVLEAMLTPLGFVVHRVIFEEEGEAPVENLYARLGTAAPNLCFAGHTDVVPPGDSAQWVSLPFEPEVRDGILYGRGTEDMKGAIACFIAAVSNLVMGASSRARPQADEGSSSGYGETGAGDSSSLRSFGMTEAKGSISLLITNDEEGVAINGTRKMLDWLHERGEKLDGCIVGEPTNPTQLGEMIKVGRRGSITCDLVVRGIQGHIAYPERADNPVTRLVHILHEMKAHALDQGTEFFPPSNLEITSIDVANPTVNLIPAAAHAKFNIRFSNLQSGAGLEQWLHEVCQRHATNYELRSRISGEAFLTRDESLIATFSEAVTAITGRVAALSTTGGTSDARFIKDVCPVIEFGTTGHTAHAVNECVSVDTLQQLTRIYERFLQGYFG
jgi:succinyl-diaminopimelate desuccinylase